MQMVLGVVGGVVGGFFGGPVGAQLGFMLGSLIGGLLFQPKPPALPDLKIQGGAYGKYIPRVYGRYRVAGNIIWAGPVSQVTEDKKKAPVQAAIIPVAIALCKGPIVGVTRIWANSKLVYDVTNPSNFAQLSGSAQMVSGFTLYLGDENQMPDATMQSYLGVGNVPAHRGMAYVVFPALDLLKYGNVLPQLEFEVITSGSMPWVQASVATGTMPAGTGVANAPNLTATTANYMSLGGYLYAEQFTAYGANMLAKFPTSMSDIIPYAGYADVPGTFSGAGKWYDFYTGISFSLDLTGFVGSLGALNSIWKNGGDFYATSSASGGRIIYCLYPLGLQAAISAAPAGGGGWIIIGGSASYLYAIDNSASTWVLRKLNRYTLADTGVSWNVPASTPGTGITTGYVVDDDNIYCIGATGLYLFKPSTGVWNRLYNYDMANPGSALQGARHMYVVNQNLIVVANATATGGPVTFGYYAQAGQGAGVPLSTIVADICAAAGLSSGQYDVSQLTDNVLGYALTNYTSGRTALDPLMSLYFFDAVDSEGKIKFVKRGGSSVATIPWGDLSIPDPSQRQQDGANPLQENMEDTHTLPRTFLLTYKGAGTDYLESSQRAFRSTTQSNLDSAAQVPLVLTDGEAATRVQAMLWTAWTNRRQFSFGTSISYLQYEPTDVVTVTDQDGTLYTVRLLKCGYDGKGALAWTAAFEGQTYPNLSSFVAGGGASAGFPKQYLPYSGPSVLVPLDLPPLRVSDVNPGLYLAACGYDPSWPGVAVEVSRDSSTYASLTKIATGATIGVANGVLGGYADLGIPDELNTVSVSLYNGTLSSVTYDTFLSGTNLAYLGGEIFAFRTATQTAANTYTLSGLIRGLYGTEAFVNSHVSAERFVFLDPKKLFLESLLNTDLGNTLYYEYQLANMFYQTPTPVLSRKVSNGCVKPFSPSQLTAVYGSASSLNDITANWFRRARVTNGWLDGADVPLDESVESYQVYVYAGATLKRTTVVTGPFTATNNQPSQGQGNPTWVYTDANIQADGFGVKGSGQTITIKVAQNSDQGLLGDLSTTTIVR